MVVPDALTPLPGRAGAIIDLKDVTKEYPGQSLSFRGTKLELKGPLLWARNLKHALRMTTVDSLAVSALRGVDLRIVPGEIFGLLGPNGSGKTTLIKVIAGLLRPTYGKGTVAGIPLHDTRSIRQRVSYVSTTGWMGLEWALTAEENIRFYGELCGLTRTVASIRTEEALRLVDLWEDRKKSTSGLSNGMRQRVMLARGLVLSTPIVLLDEPSVGLDPITRGQVIKTICDTLVSRGQTLILADHDAELVGSVADRVAILHQGMVQIIGAPNDLLVIVSHLRVLDIVMQSGVKTKNSPPPIIHRWDTNERPGTQALTHWRGLVEESPDALHRVLEWLCPDVRHVVEISFLTPTLQDVMGMLEEEYSYDG